MADSSTTTPPLLNLIAGDCWARSQLRSRIKDVSVASMLMKSLTLVRVVFIGTLAIPELDVRFHHNRLTDSGSGCRRVLDLTPATQRYKGHLCGIKTYEIAVFCGEDLYSTSAKKSFSPCATCGPLLLSFTFCPIPYNPPPIQKIPFLIIKNKILILISGKYQTSL